MTDANFETWWDGFCQRGELTPLRLGQTREQIRAVLGEPDDTGATSRHQRRPLIWLYRDVESHFGSGRDDGLTLIYREDSRGVPVLVIGC